MRVAQSWKGHSSFPSTLQGETGAAHVEMKMGHIEKVKVLHLIFFFFKSVLVPTPHH